MCSVALVIAEIAVLLRVMLEQLQASAIAANDYASR